MKIHNMEQWATEWFDIRKYKMTASHAQEISAQGKWLETYVYDIIAKTFSSWENENFTNKHTERWNELEPLARDMYELETWNEVQEVWFITIDDYTWCSPDGLVWDDWLIEIKSLMDKEYIRQIATGKIDTKYLRQMQMQMYVCERQWCDFIAYNPNFTKSLRIKRIERNEEKIEKLKAWIDIWKEMILQVTKKVWL